MIKHKLHPSKVYEIDVTKPEKKLLSPCLIPSFGFQKKLSDENAEWFANKWAKQGWGNFMRLFAAGNWEPKLKLTKPYKKNLVRKYNLDKKNPKHFNKLWRRAGYFAERDIIPMFTLLDNCSLYEWHGPGFWNSHWMNGKKNKNGTHDRWFSQTHCEEHLDDPAHKATYDYLNDLYEYVLTEAKRHFGKFFLIEIGNEIDARINYHRRLRKMCDTTLKQGNLDRRVFTSMLRENANFYDSGVKDSCIRVLHNVKDYQTYLDRKHIFGTGTHMVSQDGQMPFKSRHVTKTEVWKLLRSESKGYEGNLRPLLELQDDTWVNVGYDADWTMRTLPFKLFRGYSRAFTLYLEGL